MNTNVLSWVRVPLRNRWTSSLWDVIRGEGLPKYRPAGTEGVVELRQARVEHALGLQQALSINGLHTLQHPPRALACKTKFPSEEKQKKEGKSNNKKRGRSARESEEETALCRVGS